MSIFNKCPYNNEECVYENFSLNLGIPKSDTCNTCSVKRNLSNCDKQDETDKLSDISNERVVKTLMAGEESKTTVKELRDMLDSLVSTGKGDYKVNLIIFTGYERGHETSRSKIKLHSVDDAEEEVLLQGEDRYE